MPRREKWVKLPEGAVVVYPVEVVRRLFGHGAESSTRKEMSRRDIPAVRGWPVEAVNYIFGLDDKTEE